MVSDKDKTTMATVATILTVVSGLAARIQNPNARGVNAAIEHKVASALMKRINAKLPKNGAL